MVANSTDIYYNLLNLVHMLMNQIKKITIEDVKRIASLAKVSLSDTEIRKFQKEFQDIISYFNTLSEVDTTGIREISQVTGITNVFRSKDRIRNCLSRKHALQNAPEQRDGYFKVPSPLRGVQ